MDLIQFIVSQGVDPGLAAELAQRKAASPNLTGLVVGGRWIKLCLPSAADGQKFNVMVENNSPPMSNTDREFLEGHCNGSQFAHNPAIGDNYRKECEAAGGSTLGRKYLSQLARFPGDPQAWVSGRGDVQKVLEERGWGCEGSVTTKGRGRVEPPPEPIPIADHIVDRETAKELIGQTVTRKEYLRTREKVADKITPPDKKKKKS